MNAIIICLITISLLSCKTKYVFVKSKPYDFQTTIVPKKPPFKIMPNTVYLYKHYMLILENSLKFHNEQIAAYFESFKKRDNQDIEDEDNIQN